MSSGVCKCTAGMSTVLFMYVHVFAHVCNCMCDGRAAHYSTSRSGGEAELELLEGRETGSSSLHTSLFKGAIKVWQKCQCCRQGTGL